MRPSWHKDLKWLFGLICLIAVLVAAVAYSLRSLTAEEPATGVFTAIMTSFAKEGDGEEGWDEVRAEAAKHPEDEFTIEGATLPVKGSEIADLSYDEAVDLVVGRIADQLYTEGPDAVEQYFQRDEKPEEGSPDGASPDEGGFGGESDEFGLGPFALLTSGTHDTLHDVFTIAAVVAVVTMVPLAFFSRRFGRLGSPGLALALGTAPLAVFWFIASKVTSGESGSGGSDDLGASLGAALEPTAAEVSERFLMVLLLGVGMIGVAIVGNVLVALWRRFRRARAEKPAEDDGQAEPSPDWDEYPLFERGNPFPV